MSGTGTLADGSRILVVRLGAMGDIVHALPAAASLKHSFPGARLTWVVEPRWAPLLAGNPFVDEVALLRRGSARSVLASLQQLRQHRYDLAVDLQGLLKSAVTASAVRPDRLVGFHRSLLRERWAALFYSVQAKSEAVHVVDRNLDLAAAAGAGAVLKSFPLPPGRPEGELPAGEFVLASPLAGWTSKQWPLSFFAEVVPGLRELGLTLVVNGPPASAEVLRSIPGALAHLSGIDGLIDATRRASAVLGVDSGPMHLAAALGKPGVAVFGPTDPARNGPYGGSLSVLRAPEAVTSYKRAAEIDESMRRITPDRVLEALRRALDRRAAERTG